MYQVTKFYAGSTVNGNSAVLLRRSPIAFFPKDAATPHLFVADCRFKTVQVVLGANGTVSVQGCDADDPTVEANWYTLPSATLTNASGVVEDSQPRRWLRVKATGLTGTLSVAVTVRS